MENRFGRWLVKHAIFCVTIFHSSFLTSVEWSEELEDSTLLLSDEEPEKLVMLHGILALEIVPGYPYEESIENRGPMIHSWRLNLDPESIETICTTPVRAAFHSPASIRESHNFGEVELVGDFPTEEWLSAHVGQKVSVQGYLFHGHTVHHNTPVLIDSKPWRK